jgi:hypothetical protein
LEQATESAKEREVGRMDGPATGLTDARRRQTDAPGRGDLGAAQLCRERSGGRRIQQGRAAASRSARRLCLASLEQGPRVTTCVRGAEPAGRLYSWRWTGRRGMAGGAAPVVGRSGWQ